MLLPEAERIPAVAESARAQAAQMVALVERALAGRPWLLPEFSAADVMMGYSVKLASLLGLVGDATPNLTAYLARCEEAGVPTRPREPACARRRLPRRRRQIPRHRLRASSC
jgi:glutathione S-transferase